jgi:hypothetical protein
VAFLLLGGETTVLGQGGEARVLQFEHPPLNYRGPDPTSNYFLPSNTTLDETVSTLLPPVQPLHGNYQGQEYQTAQEYQTGLAYQTGPALSGQTVETFLPPPPLAHFDPGVYPIVPFPELVPGITDHKDGFFQKIGFTTTWIDRNNKVDDFGITELSSFATFALPLPSRDWPLLITPAFNVLYMYGPKHIDFPNELYETYLDLLWLPRLGARWTAIIGVAPALYGDFDVSASDAFRLTGKGLLRYDWSPGCLQVVLGVLYPNRDDVRILPAGGLIWTPSSDRRYELLFPQPKLAHRILVAPYFEDWTYLGAEFGGNSYAYERFGGTADSATLRDFRVYLGLERKFNGGAGYRLEIGYVMGRVIEFASSMPDVEADDTAMLRGGLTY